MSFWISFVLPALTAHDTGVAVVLTFALGLLGFSTCLHRRGVAMA
ncbi:hypothetical protein [Polymorphospora rubra]|nr:hypothetical protein [Polymorphospora rubra]